ncbi:PAS domain S-box protein [Anaerophaga thermohalophila]|uniref:PAS domain S-box protein n=1 Tax=Anaerophaga thermohalophila TaxID=177400 RepID=UPI0002D6C174|nr:PAS domain S-box protein [Anaerophaga thermohalophila]
MYSTSKILLLNNKPELARDLQTFLTGKFGATECLHQSRDAIPLLANGEYDLLVLSNHLNDMEGIEFVRLLRKRGISVPFVMLAGDGDVLQAVEAMKEGAVEFIQWSDNREAFYPYLEEVFKRAIHKSTFEKFFTEGELIYKTLFDNLRDAVFLHLIDEETRIPSTFVEVNPVACRRLGYSREELSTMTPADIDVPGAVDIEKVVDALFANGSTIFKTAHKTKDGKEIPVEVNAKLFDLKGNKVVLSVARNITDQQKMLDDLKNSELRFRSIIDKCIVGICILNEKGVYEYVNDAYCKIYGYAPHEMIGRQFTMVAPEKSKKILINRHNEFFRTGKIEKKEWTAIAKNGNERFVITDSTLITDVDGNFKRVTFVEDVTEERLAKQALEMSELRYRTMMENLQDPIFISDENFNIRFVNKAFKKRFGDTTRHSKCYRKVFGESGPCPWCMVAIQNMSRFRKRLEKTINKRVYQITTVPIQFEGDYQAKMTILRDVTKVVKARKRAEESDKLKSAFLANISHEIRTPLNAVLGFSNLLKDEDLTRDEMKMYIDMINESGSHLLHVMDDIIEFSFIDSGLVQVKPLRIKTDRLLDYLYKETTRLQKKMNKAHLQVNFVNHLPEDVRFVNDETRVRQVLQNLLSNAVKFTEKGEISLRVYHDENKWVVFSVKDTGIGIPKKLHDVIFRRFRQADEGQTRMFGGNGLGLALSKHLAEMMGGHIKVDSEPGKGSEFRLYVPEKFDESLARALSVEYVR